ncbi:MULTISPECIES: SIS domain-containing protein [unclassified Rhizobium]|uniref:SIS domain-containing protein n=1 Tax=unclassified Rhizobium TaxID=2613769 RepID=UPI001ADC0D0D|nr:MULTISPECIES: SIS domain-containing protein [unclassified Rhizobium]MBO9127288.1 SIS domain-containing protein [Rhizobium sp. 16-488-2b]MBO9177731.1 SIS domain-containing protein [Rhizobium sp. 16-488-2a]
MAFNHTSATWTEILRQPAIWRNWAPELKDQAADIRAWIKVKDIREIWMCGAGTSAFIGDILAASSCSAVDGPLIRAVPTTDFVASPADYVRRSAHILVVQFGRSGDSSETVGMLELLDKAMPEAHRLHITCNPDGALATRPAAGPGEQKILLLPAETHDHGFAMTSSFTTMLLSALACIDGAFDPATTLPALSTAADTLLAELTGQDAPVCPPRMIFLGGGALKGLAREAALKVLELTAGQVMVQWDSPLGFRHGPKAAVVPGTHIALMVHPDEHTSRYDIDVINELRSQYPGAVVTTLGAAGCDVTVPAIADPRALAVLYILAGQVWAVRWSAGLGLEVDNPFASGTLSRVVSGVTLYPWAA